MIERGRVSISSTARRYPQLPYQAIKDDILGRTYALSLVFVGTSRAQAINRTNRGKSYIPNVLSFPLDAHTGEIFITPQIARKEASARDMTVNGYTGFLFIHALLHLKGMHHGDTMDVLEKRYCTKYRLA
ncbi:rRNA maturation RNase YbeY [Candidatus Kaiserbacteria bacterium]|nr:rRNA maturation RNase YbeY [Candidatus Kaiserbacteria bacterium]